MVRDPADDEHRYGRRLTSIVKYEPALHAGRAAAERVALAKAALTRGLHKIFSNRIMSWACTPFSITGSGYASKKPWMHPASLKPQDR